MIAKIARGVSFMGAARYVLGERLRLDHNRQPEIIGGNMARLGEPLPLAEPLLDCRRTCLDAGPFQILSPLHTGNVVFQADPLVCKRCAGPLKVVAYIADAVAIRRILDRLGLSPPEKPPPDVREVVRVPVDDEGREIGANPA